jgi:hypothetical protein
MQVFFFAIVGTGLGILIELATPWSDVIMQQINSTLTDPSISTNPSLSSLIRALGIFGAYILLPSVGATGGFFLGSNSG